MAKKLISRFLDTVGDGTGTKNAIGNYSGAAEEFLIAPDSGETWVITRLIVAIEDAALTNADDYGSTGAALSNGITVDVQDDSGVVYSLTDPDLPITSNAEWAFMCYDADLKDWGAGNNFVLVRWTFARSGRPVRLRSQVGEKLVVTLNDNLTGLVAHYFLAQGYESEEV